MTTLSIVGAALPNGAASASAHSPASQLLSDALNAAQQSGSMHFVDKTTVNGSTQTLEGAISAPTAGETLTSSAPLQVELIGGSIYVVGNAEALEQSLQISAAQAQPYAGKWIVVQTTDAPFQLLAQDLTLGSTIDEFTPAQNGLKIGKMQRIGKHQGHSHHRHLLQPPQGHVIERGALRVLKGAAHPIGWIPHRRQQIRSAQRSRSLQRLGRQGGPDCPFRRGPLQHCPGLTPRLSACFRSLPPTDTLTQPSATRRPWRHSPQTARRRYARSRT